MENQNVREVLIDFLDKKHFDIKIDQDIEVYDPEEIVDSYLKSINLNQSERQPVTDNKGNGNKCSCDYPLIRTSTLAQEYCGICGEDL